MFKLLKDHFGNEYGVVIEKDGVRTSIPFCNDNTDYQAFKLALTQGAVLQDADGVEIDGKTFLGTLK